jgi:hypothetical protein
MEQLPQAKFIQSSYEADLYIAHFIKTNLKDQINQIVSTDTDYFVLLYGTNTYISQGGLYPVYSIDEAWSNIPEINEELVYRLAPLLGNDYTNKEMIISNNTFDTFISMLKDKNKVALKSNTKLAKCFNPNKAVDPESLDEQILKYSPSYFKKYYISYLIYKYLDKYKYSKPKYSIKIDIEKEKKKVNYSSEDIVNPFLV